ncbi:ATP/GTP-binding protein [Actinomadura harenae]|uniref:ATP/GTP-binding protein n=1 Tax=Actinomadura harenae TaxID=2483351 RepID=A0A3M2M7Y0_9ACTN|nr:ATP/GTP-binding protein [Actinomadura harenae]RMI45716.1 ATP/GTP-binding protein [Actinomadura harenae]
MSPRKNRRNSPDRRGPGGGGASWADDTEDAPDGEWHVRTVAGANAAKAYRCPGCDQLIPAGVGHIVAWPSGPGGADDRRHWHRPCWQARSRRAPNTVRSRNAPRY